MQRLRCYDVAPYDIIVRFISSVKVYQTDSVHIAKCKTFGYVD